MLNRTLFLLGIVYLATTNGKQLVLSSTRVFINVKCRDTSFLVGVHEHKQSPSGAVNRVHSK